MEETSGSDDVDVNSIKSCSKNGKGKNRDKKVARKNSDLSCKSKRSVKRKLKTFSFGNWQRSLSKEKSKKRTFNLDRETCRSSSSLVSESSIDTVTCICTGYRKTKATVEKNTHHRKAAVNICSDNSDDDDEDESNSNDINSVAENANSNHEEITYQDIQEASGGNILGAESSRPCLPNISEINLRELTLALRNHFLPHIGEEQLVVRYSDLALPYRPSGICRLSVFGSAHTQIDYVHHLVPGLSEITNCSFYWGKMDRYKAEKQLENKPEGSFLLRDSAQEEYLFSVSFRRYGRTLHARIEQLNHKFSFDSHDPNVFASPTVCGLLEHYKNPRCCMFFEPMLTLPVHRTFPFDLQHICRSVIADRVTYDSINLLNLPKKIKSYLKEYHYKQKIRVRHLENDV